MRLSFSTQTRSPNHSLGPAPAPFQQSPVRVMELSEQTYRARKRIKTHAACTTCCRGKTRCDQVEEQGCRRCRVLNKTDCSLRKITLLRQPSVASLPPRGETHLGFTTPHKTTSSHGPSSLVSDTYHQLQHPSPVTEPSNNSADQRWERLSQRLAFAEDELRKTSAIAYSSHKILTDAGLPTFHRLADDTGNHERRAHDFDLMNDIRESSPHSAESSPSSHTSPTVNPDHNWMVTPSDVFGIKSLGWGDSLGVSLQMRHETRQESVRSPVEDGIVTDMEMEYAWAM
jgi:hypothetical protein